MDETSRPHEFNIHDGKGVQFTSNGSQSQTNNFYTAHRSLFEAHWLPGAEELVVGVPLVRTLRILNHDDEPHTVSLSWGGSPYRRIARSVTSTTVPAGQEVDVDVTFTAEAASPPGGATVEIHMLVLRGKRFETEAKIELTVTRLFAVALAIVEEEIKGDHVAAAVVVRNAGNIDLQAVNVFGLDEQGKAVKPWSKQPFPLGIGQDRRIPVKIRRQPWHLPWAAAPTARFRALAGQCRSEPASMAVPPVVAPSTLTVGCAAALAVIVAFVLCVPMFSGDEQPGTDTADSSQSSPAAATYPADLLLDRAGSKDVSRRPVLIERSGTRTTLPAGGGVHVAVRTPGGWLVKRTVAGRDYELLHIVDGSEPRQIARGTGLSFWVHDSGKRVVVDLRGAQSGVRVLALDTGAEQSGTLPTAVKIIDWIGDLVLVRLPRPDAPEQPAAADFRLDRWNPSKPYESTPGETGGRVWGIADGLVLTYEPATGCFTLAVPATRFAPARPPRCDLPFDIDLRVLDGNWSGLSPDGRTVALPGARGVPAFIPLDDLFGTGTPRSVTGIDHGVSELRWRDNGEVVVLEAGGAGRLTVCGSGTATCSAAETPTRDGFDLTQLAIRVGAG